MATVTPTVGRIVEYTTLDRNGNKAVRPAIVVAVWSQDLVNLQVFTDGFNDNPYGVNSMWKTSVRRDEEKNVNTWDWMEYQKGQAAKTEEVTQELKALSGTIKENVQTTTKTFTCPDAMTKTELPRIPTTTATTPTPQTFVCPDTLK